MSPRKRTSRVYWRDQGGARRAYGDFRDYRDVGGKLEPLVASGEKRATTDPDVATRLAAARLDELEQARRRRAFHGKQAGASTLKAFAREHLIAKKKAGRVTDEWIAATEKFLQRAIDFLGAERELDTIRPNDVREFAAHITSLEARPRKEKPKKRRRKKAADTPAPAEQPKRTMAAYTIRAHLFALSNLYRRAQECEVVPVGYNPVASLMEKPGVPKAEARWLEVPDAALLLESARTLPTVVTPAGEGIGAELAYPFIATYLLTGGRDQEVRGLELDDVSFDRKTVTFRPNDWRRLKTQTSWRVMPLHPQLEEILRAYVFGSRVLRGGRLLFPTFVDGRELMLTDTRKLLDRIAARAGWKKGEIRCRLFRHTYCAARLQTLDRGAPVSIYTVSRELGHGSEEMVRRVYAHLGEIRHRSEAVEYRVEQHAQKLGDRLQKLGFVTGNVTVGEGDAENRTPRHHESESGAGR